MIDEATMKKAALGLLAAVGESIRDLDKGFGVPSGELWACLMPHIPEYEDYIRLIAALKTTMIIKEQANHCLFFNKGVGDQMLEVISKKAGRK